VLRRLFPRCDVCGRPIPTAGPSVFRTRWAGQSGNREYPEDGSVAAGWLRISRAAARTIGAPWFSFALDVSGCSNQTCECGFFSARARAASFTPAKISRVGHLVRVVAIPTDTSSGVAFRMEHLLNHGM
jgi:hypothetical protein